MKHQLSTTLYKINWKYIINNATNRKFWNKSFPILKYHKHIFELSPSMIYINDNRLALAISCKTMQHCYSQTITISLHEEHYNETVFNQQVAKSLFGLIENFEESIIQRTNEYRIAEDMQSDIYYSYYDYALDQLQHISLTQDQCESLATSYADNFAPNYTYKIYKKMKYKYAFKMYLTIFTSFQYESLRDTVLEANTSHAKYKEILKEIEEVQRLIEDGEYEFEEME